MTRLIEPLAYVLLSITINVVVAVLLLGGADAASQGEPKASSAVMLGSGATSELIEAWETPPAAAPSMSPELSAAPSDSAVLLQQPLIEPNTPAQLAAPAARVVALPAADTPPQISLPALRPQLPQQIALPTAPPEIRSSLQLSQSDRPAARPERRAPRAAEAQPLKAAPRQQPSGQQKAADPVASGLGKEASPQRQTSGGNGGTQPAQQPSGGADTSGLMTKWQAQIASCMQRRIRAPASLSQTGRVVLNLQITPNGRLQGIGIAASSGIAEIDRAALSAVQGIGRCPAAPRGLNAASYPFQIPVNLGPR